MNWARGLHICTYSFSNKYRDAVGIATDSKSFEYYMYKKILSITFLIKYECRTKVQLTILHNRILQKTKTTSKYTPPSFPLLPSTTAVTYRSYLREQLEFNNNSSIGKHPSIAKLFSTGCCS